MSIFNVNADAAERAASQVKALIRSCFNFLSTNGQRGFDLIWNNANATPEQILAALGTDAEVTFHLAQLNIQTVEYAAQIGGLDPASIPQIPSVPDQYNLSFDDEGNAVLTNASDIVDSSSGI